jgi:hypothetical protein
MNYWKRPDRQRDSRSERRIVARIAAALVGLAGVSPVGHVPSREVGLEFTDQEGALGRVVLAPFAMARSMPRAQVAILRNPSSAVLFMSAWAGRGEVLPVYSSALGH